MRKLEEILDRGQGLGFWILCVLFSVGFYSLIWLMMALSTLIGD